MDTRISQYFCIFCEKCTHFECLSEAYDHYNHHMKVQYYCVDCDNDRKCNAKHSPEGELDAVDAGLIQMWTERFLSYQSELIDKTYSDLFRSCKLFTGCAVCQTFLRLCTQNDIKYSKGDIQWSHNEALSNETRHVCSHLRYYPFECNKCESDGRYHKKCDMSEITRHIRNSHSSTLKTTSFDSLVKSVKIAKLESFIQYCFENRKQNVQSIASNAPAVMTPTRTSKRLLTQTPKPIPIVSVSKPKKPKLETQMVVANNGNESHNNAKSKETKTTTICSDKNDVVLSLRKPKTSNHSLNNSLSFTQNKIIINKPLNGNQKVTNSLSKSAAKVEIKFKPIVKTYSQMNNTKQNLISGDQIIIKKVPEVNNKGMSLINKTALNSAKMPTKELAYEHMQRHLDYFPIICLTCGEGLTDLQSFMKHHRQSHPEAVKGRYKKKEQPVMEKWIASYLYSQTTIIRSFPPRETCPVCDRVFSRTDIQNNKPRRCTINRKIDHLYRHLSYLPYECVLCKQSGSEFLVAYFESKAHSHIKLKHPEIDDNESRWHVFQKTISIPKLDEFIENYLAQYGISMQLERRPIKKAMKYSSPTDSGANNSEDKSSLDNIVVDVSPLNMIYKTIPDDSEEELYFCIFCSETKNFSKIDAYSHYGQHLDYFPVLCKICWNKFEDVDRLMAHHQSDHSTQDNVDYEICEDQSLVKWVNEFLDSQLAVKKVMPCSCGYNCPVCMKLMAIQSVEGAVPCAQHNDVLFSVHIHKHLNYFPYECNTCKRNGKSVRVPNLDSIAMNHMREHNIESASMSQVVKNFPKTLVIPRLEKLIGDCVHRKRVGEKKNRIDLSQLNALQPTLADTNSLPLIALNNEPSTSTFNKTQHIRLEGGRIVNLPPKTSITSQSVTSRKAYSVL
ncbi:unnamed protein product [Oppiella nova]|uniref:C2H2-type domain-containing protein n=1 Tax=Oppiella nova TaxID=334625 RepID=A0A7R9LY81_9ACAR|nr:unnamed protein product [Oppiella nova]CAG2168074.1 unnamed protein product [Oppiella nova]